MYQCVHYIKYTSIYKVHVPMCPLYKVHLYNYTKYMYQCVHYIKYTSIYKVHVPMCPLYKVHLYNYTKYMYQCVHYIKYTSIYKVHVPMCPLYKVHLYIQSTVSNRDPIGLYMHTTLLHSECHFSCSSIGIFHSLCM